jgi:hypothetical protein
MCKVADDYRKTSRAEVLIEVVDMFVARQPNFYAIKAMDARIAPIDVPLGV